MRFIASPWIVWLAPFACSLALCPAHSAAAAAAADEQWPQFRGPAGQGVSAEAHPPQHWSETQNVAWKADVFGLGWSSPIVWGDQVFVTSTSEDGISCHVISLARTTGKVLWDVEVFTQTPTRKEDRNSYATPTPVTDGRRVYAFFSSGKAAAVDFDGKPAWKDEDLHYYSVQGLGASPILYKDLLIMPWDHSSEQGPREPGWIKPWDQSYVLALDKETGKTRYKAMRGMTRAGHVMPKVIDVDGEAQLISPAGDFVQAFNPDTGEKLWWVKNKGETPVPSVVYGGGLLFTTSGFEDPTIRAIRPGHKDERGDLTATHVAWELKKVVPMMPSFLYVDGLLYCVKETGIALCIEAATGKIIWQQRLDGTYSASPLLAAGRVYFLSDDGLATVIEAGREFKVLAQSSLHEPCRASIAVTHGQFLIRTRNHLFCIEEKGGRER